MFMHKVTKPNQLGPCVRILPKDVVIKIDIGGVWHLTPTDRPPFSATFLLEIPRIMRLPDKYMGWYLRYKDFESRAANSRKQGQVSSGQVCWMGVTCHLPFFNIKHLSKGILILLKEKEAEIRVENARDTENRPFVLWLIYGFGISSARWHLQKLDVGEVARIQ